MERKEEKLPMEPELIRRGKVVLAGHLAIKKIVGWERALDTQYAHKIANEVLRDLGASAVQLRIVRLNVRKGGRKALLIGKRTPMDNTSMKYFKLHDPVAGGKMNEGLKDEIRRQHESRFDLPEIDWAASLLTEAGIVDKDICAPNFIVTPEGEVVFHEILSDHGSGGHINTKVSLKGFSNETANKIRNLFNEYRKKKLEWGFRR
ncbi:MAG: hypothetical protein V1835_02910 [Candidatus Micrarchaeota archaeon]